MMKFFLLTLLATLLAGCSAPRVTTDFAEGTDFSAYRTFEYRDSTSNLATSSPLSHQRIVSAIRSGMMSSGLSEVTDNPDVFVTYYGSTEQQTQFHTTYSGVNNWHGSFRDNRALGIGATSSTTRTTTITQGTLVIDIWDARRNAMVWRSVATSTLGTSPEQNARLINDAVQRAFSQFPPPPR